MLDHVSITVSDIGAAEVFYDAIMAALGIPKVRRSETRLGYGERCDGEHPDRCYLSIKLGDKPEPAFVKSTTQPITRPSSSTRAATGSRPCAIAGEMGGAFSSLLDSQHDPQPLLIVLDLFFSM
jgi:hypothetical protein